MDELEEIERRSQAMVDSMRTSKWGKPAVRPEASEREASGEAAGPGESCSDHTREATVSHPGATIDQ